MNASGGRIKALGTWARLCFLLICSVTVTVQPAHYSSTEKEALRVLSKHKALFTLIPQRVAQILKMVRLHAHAAPAQRLEIVHGALEHAEGKNRIVVQLRDAIAQVRFKLAPHLRDQIKTQFTTLEKRFTDYISTLESTRKVLGDEQNKLLVAANLATDSYKSGKAYQTAQAVLAPNHIDTLVDTLAGHDRAVSTAENAAIDKLSQEVKQLRAQVIHTGSASPQVVVVNTGIDEEFTEEVAALRDEVAALNEKQEQPAAVAPIAKDFAQAMADMSVMHSLATLESAQAKQAEKAEEEAHKKEKKKKKKEKKAQEKAEEEKKDKDEKEEKVKKPSVATAIGNEITADVQVVGRGLLRLYRGVKQGLSSVVSGIAAAPRTAYNGLLNVRDRVASQADTLQPALMSGIMVGSMASPGAWSLAGKLRTASLLDPTRIVEQPLLPETIQKAYDDALLSSGEAVKRVWHITTAGARKGLQTLENAAHKSGSLVAGGTYAAGSLAAGAARGAVNLSSRGVGAVAHGTRSLGGVASTFGTKAKEVGSGALDAVRTTACKFGARICAIGAATYDHAKVAAHKAADMGRKGLSTVAGATRSLGNVVHAAGTTIKDLGTKAGTAAVHAARTAACQIGAKTCAIGAVTYRGAQQAAHAVGSGARAAYSGVASVASGARESASSVGGAVTFDGVAKGTQQFSATVLTRIKKELGAIADASAYAMRVITHSVESVGNSIGVVVSFVWGKIGDLADMIRSGLTTAFGGGSVALSTEKQKLTTGAHSLMVNGSQLAQSGVRCVADVAGRCVRVFTDSAHQALHIVGTGAQKAKDMTFAATQKVFDTVGSGVHAATGGAAQAGSALRTMGGSIGTTTQSLGGYASHGIARVAGSAKGLLDTTGATVRGVAGSLQTGVARGTHIFKDSLGVVADNAYLGVSGSAQMVRNGLGAAAIAVHEGGRRLGSTAGSITGSLRTGLSSAAGMAGAGVVGVATQTKQFTFTFSEAIARYWAAFNNLLHKVLISTGSVLRNIKDVLFSGTRFAREGITGTARAVSGQLISVGTTGTQKLRTMGARVADDTRSSIGTVYQTAGSVAQQVNDIARSGVETAYNGATALTRGISTTAQTATHRLGNLAGEVSVLGKQTGQQVGAFVRNSTSKVYNGTDSLVRGISAAAGSAGENFGSAIRGIGQVGYQTTAQIGDVARNGVVAVQRGAHGAMNTVKNISIPYQQITSTVKDGAQICLNTMHGCVTRGAAIISNGAVHMKKGFHSFLSSAQEMLGDTFVRVSEFIGAMIGNIQQGLSQLGASITVLINKVTTMVGGSVTAASDAAGALRKNVVR